VRSSATAEDLGDASFAGQHGTYYYVDQNHLLKMIRHCWASLWSPEAISYRNTHGIDHGSVFMAVVVQEMIKADVAGVTFTANPVTGNRDEIVIEASLGMGAAIVDGRVTPDHYVVHRGRMKLKEKRIAEKRVMVPPDQVPGSPERLLKVPYELQHKQTLSADTASTIATWAVKAEEHFGSPQDVEWALFDGNYYMLQSRPITVMGTSKIGRNVTGKRVLFKPMVENFTDPLTPLTADIVNRTIPRGFSIIGKRIYLDLTPIKLIIPLKLSDREVVQLVYHAIKPEKPRISLLKLPLFLSFIFLVFVRLGVLMVRTRRMPDDFMDIFRNLAQRVEQDPHYNPLRTMERLWTLPKLFDPAGYKVLLVNFTSIRYAPWLDILNMLLRHWVPNLRQDAATLLCAGGSGVKSAEMGYAIWMMAKEANSKKTVRDLFLKYKPEELLAQLTAESEATQFRQQLAAFLAINGHRALKEMELMSVRWEENPAPVLGMVRNYLLTNTNPDEHLNRRDQTRVRFNLQIMHTITTLFFEKKFRPRERLLRFIIRRIQYFSKLRENSRFYHIMAFNIVRKKILEIEGDFLTQGKLKCKNDIFFLKWDEILALQSGQMGWLDVEDSIRERRLEHVRLSRQQPPVAFGVDMTETEQPAEATAKIDILTGQPASSGTYQGVAHVILNPTVDIELKPGEILVAPYTDPAWTPLFLTASAVVVEVGSFLSHAGTVAREYGLPCVVDVKDCIKKIHSGDLLRVNGDEGIVRILYHHKDDDFDTLY
ncbi:PEP/pyruvate-binding domain-containing protein, partial [candidate division CSSED10-310 bacterium]